MGFVLKIYFVGLIAFVPGADGRDMTVLLLDGRDGYALSDGTWMDAHEPLLLARAGRCSGDCRPEHESIADFLFQREPEENRGRLDFALGGGGAWRLDGSELRVEVGGDAERAARTLEIRGGVPSLAGAELRSVPPSDPGEFAWVADMGRIAPGAATVDPDVMAEDPRKGLVVARLKVASGEIQAERLVTLDDQVVQLAFEPLREGAPRIDYTQPLADRVLAEIPIGGCEVTLTERRFDGEPGRTMTLAPERCDGTEVVEAALVNLPRHDFGPRIPDEPREDVGKHFEMYYELAYFRPPNRLRPVPVPTGTKVEVERRSSEDGTEPPPDPELLLAIGLPARGTHSRPICALSQFSPVPVEDSEELAAIAPVGSSRR